LADVQQQRTLRLELLGYRAGYLPRMAELATAERMLNEAEGRLSTARKAALAEIAMAISPAEVESYRDNRSAWLLGGGAAVLLAMALGGWLMVLLLSRPRPVPRAEAVGEHADERQPAPAGQPDGQTPASAVAPASSSSH